MYFAMLIYGSDAYAGTTPEEMIDIARAVDRFDAELAAGGANVGSVRLAETPGRVVRLEDGSPLTTDGPFDETREQLAGIWIIEASDIDAATEIAERIPMLRIGSVEVRPILGIDLRTELAYQSGN